VIVAGLDRTVCWTPVDRAGFEHLQLRAEDGGHVAKSIVLGIEGETPFRLHYKSRPTSTGARASCGCGR
jgi:hypothetical protein